MKKILIIGIVFIYTILCFPNNFIFANDSNMNYEAEVIEVIEEQEVEVAGNIQYTQKLKVRITSSDLKGNEYEILNGEGEFSSVNVNRYKKGDQVIVMKTEIGEGEYQFFVTDYIRRKPLFFLLLLFLVIALIVGKWKSISSLASLIFSFLIILKLIIPQISEGKDAVSVTILGALLILPITFYLSHGINKKTHLALAGTFVAMILTGLLSLFFVSFAKLTGFYSEEASILSVIKNGSVNIQGLLLSGIIIGSLGVLDDITISQAAIVIQLQEIGKGKLSFREIYRRSMEIGKDHIASMINTLFLVYAGASLPLLLLFVNNPRPFNELINYEPVATEIVRTLVGSIGLMLAVPITTMLSYVVLKRNTEKKFLRN